MRTSTLLAAVGFLCLPMLSTNPAHAQATRTWVSGVGDDVNPCSRTAPCKTFAGAISKTAPGGEINCLDPGGYGAVTITKSMTIDCGATLGSILASGGNGINVNGANIVVILRNLSIQGAGTGLIGINATNMFALHLDNVSVTNFNAGTAVGLRFAPSVAGNSFLNVSNSLFYSNGLTPSAVGANILIQPSVGGAQAFALITKSHVEFGFGGIQANSSSASVALTVQDSSVSNNRNGGITSTSGVGTNTFVERTVVFNNSQIGVGSIGGGSLVRINNSAIFGNSTGVGGGGVIKSYKNNAINGNGTDGTPIAQENLN